MMSKNLYAPLQYPRSTRLIEILSDPSEFVIRCRLREIDLDNALRPKYVALSYCWGNISMQKEILIDGQLFRVTENLYTALHVLKDGRHGKHFWIDAVCINQNDLLERSSQVSIMRSIYEGADKVVVWLGPASATSSAAIDLIRRIIEMLTSPSDQGVASEQVSSSTDLEFIFRHTSDGIPDLTPLAGLRELLLRSWFERVWVVQEATASKDRNPVMLCGQDSFTLQELAGAVQVVSRMLTDATVQKFFAQAERLDQGSLRRLYNILRQQRQGGPSDDFLRVLRMYRLFKASDPRDKVYALRSLAADLADDELAPNYTASYQSVYADTARHFIITQASYDCLGFCKFSHREPDLPTWAANWGVGEGRHPLAKQTNDGAAFTARVYDATAVVVGIGSSHPRYQRQCTINDGRLLRVAGFEIDVVTRVSYFPHQPPLDDQDSDSREQTIPSAYGEATQASESAMYRRSRESLRQAYRRTFVADVRKQGGLRQRNFGIDIEYWSRVNDPVQPPGEVRYRVEWGSFLYASVGRCLIGTATEYIGLAPVEAQPGDRVCAFFGADVLFLLRPHGERFLFVGECYVHGLMDGEALVLLDGNDQGQRCQSNTFEIE